MYYKIYTIMYKQKIIGTNINILNYINKIL